MSQKQRLYLKVNDVPVKRYNIGGDNQEIRFTSPQSGFEKLLAVAKHGRFTWITKKYRQGN